MEQGQYILQKSDTEPLLWVLTDTINGIVCRFTEGDFNNSQKFTALYDNTTKFTPNELARIVADMSDWLREYHYEIIFTSPTKIAQQARLRIGERISSARKQCGYSLQLLSHMTGISKWQLEQLEQGKCEISINQLALIAEMLNLQIALKNNV